MIKDMTALTLWQKFNRKLASIYWPLMVQYTMGHYHHVRKFVVRNRNLQLPHKCRQSKNICKLVDILTISDMVMTLSYNL